MGSDLLTGPALREVGERFVVLHEQFYGHSRPEDPIEVTTLRLRAAWLTEKIAADRLRAPEPDGAGPTAKGERTAFFYGCGETPAVPVFERSALPRRFSRPVRSSSRPQSTTVVPPGHRLVVGGTGEMLITRGEEGG